MSTKPGVTIFPFASMVSIESSSILPMATILSSEIPISASKGSLPFPS